MPCLHKACFAVRRLSIIALVLLIASLTAFAQEKPFDKSEFAARRAKLFEKIPDGVAIIFAAKGQIYPVKFRQSPDFFYLTGIEEEDAVLVMIGPKRQTFIFAHRRPDSRVNIEGPGIFQVENARELYGLNGLFPIENFFGYLTYLVKDTRKLYVPVSAPDNLELSRGEMEDYELRYMHHPVYRALPEIKQAVGLIQQWAPHLPVADVNSFLDDLRWVKTPYEIERMRRSGEIGAEAVKEAIKGTRPGMYEYEVEAAARFIVVKMGARGDAFTPIVASGPNTVTWHYVANRRRMMDGDVVLMDYGADYDYYASDITRTWPVSGRFTPEQEKMYRCILEARNAVISAMKPGLTVDNLKDIAEEVYKKHGFGKEFLALNRYIGHHVGMSVHDVDATDPARRFEPGVVFNVEPLLEFRDRKIHMRLEDTVLITPTGAVNLTAGVPAEIDEVYALIKQKGVGAN
ncbi:MAG: Xaa-Pro peptidase family protein [Pyrinomonadaceae bacterium]